MSVRVFTSLPDLPSIRQILNPERGWLSVIVPIARTNLITNPSFETNTTNYTAVGAGIVRDTAQQYHGAYSLRLDFSGPSAATDGVYYGTVSLTSGSTYAFSLKFLDPRGNRPYKISFATTGGVDLATYRFRSTGKWQWVWIVYTETSTTTRRLYLTKDNSTHIGSTYTDGWQCEAINAGETASTYIDGDQQSLLPAGQFPPAYGWNGVRHASTSYRTAQTRDGGQVKNLDVFKFFVTAVIGLGIADPSHIVSQQGYTDGAAYQTSIVPSREFTMSGRFSTRSNVDLKQSRKAIGAALALDATSPRQPIALLYQEHDGLEPIGDTGKIVASYNSGMGGRWDNLIGEDVEMPFQMWLPFVAGSDGGAALTQSESISTSQVSNLLYRDINGDWSNLSQHAIADVINDIVQHPDGTYYITGEFTTIGGVAANRIARYDPQTNTFSALGTGLASAGTPRGSNLWVAPDGNVWVAGNFTTANGVTVNNITFWNGTTFVAIGGATKGVDDWAQGVVGDAAGNVYITGRFLNAGGAAATRIVRWTGSAFATMSTGLNDFGFALTMGLDGTTLYVGGTFSTAGGVTVNNIAKWNGSAFSALESGLGGDALTVVTGPDGSIYAGGNFTQTFAGLTVNYVARWTGTAWQSLGSGVTTSTAGVFRLAFGYDGLLYASGDIRAVNSITTGDGFAVWNGSSWILPDVDMAGTPQGNAIGCGRRGDLMVFFYNGTASAGVAAQLNTLTNGGTAVTYPTIRITGPSSSTSRIHQIRSYTTGAILSFNLTIFANEQITITTGPGIISVTSNVRGDLSQYVLAGSATEMGLLPGTNSVALLITGGTVTAIAIWPKRFADANDLTY